MNNSNQTYSTQPKGIDWVEAQKYYMESFTRSYKDVAKKFGVSDTMVEQKGKAGDWVAIRKSLGEKAVEEFEANRILEIGKANSQHLQISRLIQGHAANLLQKLQSGNIRSSDLKNISDAMEKGINIERLVLGLPTSNTKSEILGRLQSDLSLTKDVIDDMDAFFKNESEPK